MLKMESCVHNSSHHCALKMSPYEVMTGMKPNVARMWLPGESENISEEELQKYFGFQKEQLVEICKAVIQALEEGQAEFLEIQSNKRPPHV